MPTFSSDFFGDASTGRYLSTGAPERMVVASNSVEKAAKRGEGSRGGHIIGHTKSGKARYATKVGGAGGPHIGGLPRLNHVDMPSNELINTRAAMATGKKGALNRALGHNVEVLKSHHPYMSAELHQKLSDFHDDAKNEIRGLQENPDFATDDDDLQRHWDYHNTMASTHDHLARQMTDAEPNKTSQVDHHHMQNYNGMKFLRGDQLSPMGLLQARLKNKQLISEKFSHYSPDDHEQAADHHEAQAGAWATKRAQNPDHLYAKTGHEFGVAAAQAHRDKARGFGNAV